MIVVSVGLCLACGHGTTLYDGRCGCCEVAPSARQVDGPKGEAPAPRSINALMAALVAELEAEEIAAPLAQRLTLGHVWIDLCRLVGEPAPAHVAAMLDEPTHAAPLLAAPVETHRERAYEPAD